MQAYRHEEYMKEFIKSTPAEYADSQIDFMKNSIIHEVLFMVVHSQHMAVRNQILRLNDDTIYDDSVNNYVRVARSMGFRVVLQFPFVSKDLTKEYLYVLFCDELGILLKFCTALDRSLVKSGTFYYNYKPRLGKYIPGVMADGSFNKCVWVGDHDCREALRLKIKLLNDSGEFVVPWVKTPLINLTHYCECGKNPQKITEERMALIDGVFGERVVS
jgi:hypothetical protein